MSTTIDHAVSNAGTKSSRTKSTTRVLLRVKRRRHPPTVVAAAANTTSATGATHHHRHASSSLVNGDFDNNSNNRNNNTNDIGSIVCPDRIRLALTCAPGIEGDDDGRSTKKRRRVERNAVAKKEELALVRRLDSTSLRNNNNNNDNNIGENEMFHTPSRKGTSSSASNGGGNNPYDPLIMSMMRGDDFDGTRTPPSASSAAAMSSSSTSGHKLGTNATPILKETPAPPTKPKRTVLFRKITDLQKRLSPPSSSSSMGDADHRGGSRDPQPEKDTTPRVGTSKKDGLGAGTPEKWASKGEEKSKWLRIVDVLLREEDDQDQVSSICSDDSTAAAANPGDKGGVSVADEDNDEERRVTVASGKGDTTVLGSGRRVRRMRPRPSMEGVEGEETAADNAGGEGRKKRRKLGFVVEQSRTMLESDFWKRGLTAANASDGKHDGNINNSAGDNDRNAVAPEALRLIEHSLYALHQQGGGSVAPHLSFLKSDPRLKFSPGTPRGRKMVNHALDADPGETEGNGRTVLHVAALWGDLAGVRAALEMGADPTIFDARGNTPAGLARKRTHGRDGDSYEEAISTLVEGEKRAVAEKNIRLDGSEGGEEEYYYEVYCLETETEGSGELQKKGGASSGSMEEKKDDSNNPSSQAKSFLRQRSTMKYADSIPDLERSSVLSEEDDENIRGPCSFIELQKGIGYWNAGGELILEPLAEGDDTKQDGNKLLSAEQADNRFVRKFYNDGDDSMDGAGNDDEHDSNDEAYDGNDYPEDDASFGFGSDYDHYEDDYRDADAYSGESCRSDDDDDDEDKWKLDFRNRFVTKSELDRRYGCFDIDACNDSSDDEKRMDD